MFACQATDKVIETAVYTNQIWEVNPHQHFLHYRILFGEMKHSAAELVKPWEGETTLLLYETVIEDIEVLLAAKCIQTIKKSFCL